MSKKILLSLFWHLANKNNFGSPNRSKTGKVIDFMSDSEGKKKHVSFYVVYVNFWFQLYILLSARKKYCKNNRRMKMETLIIISSLYS